MCIGTHVGACIIARPWMPEISSRREEWHCGTGMGTGNGNGNAKRRTPNAGQETSFSGNENENGNRRLPPPRSPPALGAFSI